MNQATCLERVTTSPSSKLSMSHLKKKKKCTMRMPSTHLKGIIAHPSAVVAPTQ